MEKIKQLQEQEEKAFDKFAKYLTGNQLLLFKGYLTARHLFEQERIKLMFK